MRLTRAEFDAAVEEALAEIPPGFEQYMRDIVVDVEDMPSPRDCKAVGVRDPRHLLGLYHGVPLTERSVHHHARMPDRISIYQHNIERISRTRKQLLSQIRKTVLHEIGHHFGLNEDDLYRLGYH